MADPISPVVEAERQLANLEASVAALKQRTAQHKEARDRLSFDAASGNANARKHVDGLADEIAGAAREVETLEAAIVEARRRIGVAEREAPKRAEQARALLTVTAKLRAAGKRVSKAVADLGAALEELRHATIDLARFADVVRVPDAMLLRENLKRALNTILMPMNLHSTVIAPAQRIAVDALVDQYAAQTERQAQAIIGGKKAKEAA